MLSLRKNLGFGSLVVIVVTFVLFVVALFTKGFTHDLLLEAAIFLVSVKPEQYSIILNHSDGAILCQDQAKTRRPYWGYGQEASRRSWGKSARPFGFPIGGRPEAKQAHPMSPKELPGHRISPVSPLDRRANRETELIQYDRILL